ncbi:hypothetical protein HPP92_006241 [Vanilla planifolia]|uniref:Uncharacterized protein n=1 Tax=Vanilla planifolia TaxID=51239 RepID=A0A835RVH8_VANPL|nr:hypothetical protein HPP92_006241 [Vanilla planifolia]
MASSERRWASARRSGMTVLGKVPKPINLPSQKLENHGLDPNVDLVPKGTHTWGSRPSNASNAWVTSSVSPPQFDGSLGSPNNSYGRPSSHGNAHGRPSSGGSSTRPSTAGSDKSIETVGVALGSNSRPSSASGILPSSQIPVSLNRPRSAETRPGSSQLSRFSENSSDYNAWLSEGTPERLGVVASKRSDFSLNSGDFPSLGSEKISEMKSPGVTIKFCVYDETERLTVRTEEKTLYTQEDFHDFLTRHGWASLREINSSELQTPWMNCNLELCIKVSLL